MRLQTRNAELGSGLLDLIGRTPLVRLDRIAADAPGVDILAKAEWTNPGGSVKDRPAARIVTTALASGELASGELGRGRRLLDATSGNTGIAYAMLGAALGFGVTLCLPANASPERKRILAAYGAEIVPTPAADGSDGAIVEARRLAAEQPGLYWYADQYSNPENWRAHYEGTAVEILEQTAGRLTHFVAGLGTTGTFVGVSRRLAEDAPVVRRIAVQPDSAFHGLEGLKHLETAILPAIWDPSLAHEQRYVATEDAYRMVKRLAREEGLLVGVSAGAAVHAAWTVARELASVGQSGMVVTVLPDNADKYLSERFWDET